MTLVTLSILVTVIVLNVHFRSPSTHTMPKWVKFTFLNFLPRLLLMKHSQNFQSSQSALPQLPRRNKELDANFSEYGKKRRMDDHHAYHSSDEAYHYFAEREADHLLRQRNLANPLSIRHSHSNNCHHQHHQQQQQHQYRLVKGRGLMRIPQVAKAISGVNYVFETLRKEDEEKIVKEQWKFVALVIDRLFLWVFTLACIIGTCGIILQAPSFYDTMKPIDRIYSRRYNDFGKNTSQ